MTVSVAGDSFAKAMCDALGLKRATKIVLTLEVGSATTVDATFYPDREAMEPVLRRYHLHPVEQSGEQSQQSGDVQSAQAAQVAQVAQKSVQQPEQSGDSAI